MREHRLATISTMKDYKEVDFAIEEEESKQDEEDSIRKTLLTAPADLT